MNIEPDDFCNDLIEEMEIEYKRTILKDKRLMARLKRKIKPKIFTEIEKEIEHHMCSFNFSIVGINEVKGTKEKYSNYCGESSPIRTIYNDLRSFWEDSYHGVLYLRLDKDRYFRMEVSG